MDDMTSRNFDIQDMADHKSDTTHNLSPVEGDPDSERKAKWHKERWGRGMKAATLASMGKYEYRAALARKGIK